MFQKGSTSTTSSTDLKQIDSVEVSEKQAAECARCKHYKALEEAIESIEGPLLPFWNEMKWLFYGILWFGLGFLFIALVFRNSFCAALDRLEYELLSSSSL